MAYFKYNKDAQTKFTPNHFEPFLQGVEKEKLFTIPTDKSSEDNRIRILPPWSPEGMFAKVTKLHYNVGINRNTFVCPNLVEEGSCPFCNVVAKIRNEYEKFKLDISAAGDKLRAYSNVIDVKHPNYGVMVFSYGSKIYFQIKKIQDSGEYGDITDPMEGRDLVLSRTVQGKNMFQDTVFPTGKPSSISDPDMLDNLFDLDKILPETDMDVVNRAFRSHPWKVYDGPVVTKTSVQVPNEPEEAPKKAKFDDTPQEEKYSDAPAATEQPVRDKIKEMEERIRKKLGK